jgi:hypothetical protein
VIYERATDGMSPRPSHAAQQWQFSLRGLMITVAIVSLYLAACVALVRDLGRRESLSVVLMIPAILIGASVGIAAGQFWSKRRRGPVLFRLRYRFEGILDWFSPVLVPLFALVYVAIEELLVGPPPANEFPRHFVRVLLLFWTVQSACFVPRRLSQSLLLCENGIGYGGVGLTPWEKVAPRADVLFDADGNLVIRYGSSSIVATVPPEKRQSVEAMLKEKLGAHSHVPEIEFSRLEPRSGDSA